MTTSIVNKRGLNILRWFTGLVLLSTGLFWPAISGAHGDLHLRIMEMTREIQTATTNRAELYLARGELLREHGEWKAAAFDYERAAELAPGMAEIDFCRARLLADEGELTAARAMFEKGLKSEPRNGEGLIGRGRVLLRLAETNAAIADYRLGLEILEDPDPEYYFELAQTLVAAKRKGEAIAALDSGNKKLGSVMRLQAYALELEIEEAKRAAALKRLETIIAQAMRKETWLARKGELLLLEGRSEQAREAYLGSLAEMGKLPPRLQQSPGMVALRDQVDTALAGITNAPSAAIR
jgi:tetratricopeptide (TPR) repeat protein